MILPAKRFYMIRHGQTEANKAQIMAGSDDSPLTELGIEQAHEARQVLEKLEQKPSVIVHSQLSRARDTATIINTSLNVPMIEDPDYAELHAGDWEGVSYDDCRPILDSWTNPPNGETFEAFFERIHRAKMRALGHDGTALIVCHGGVFRGFAKLYGLDIWGVRNCDLHEFSPANSSPFPWTAYAHRASEPSGQEIHTVLSDSFHPAEEMAS